MMKLMNLVLPSCQDVSHLTSQAMDETLPFGKRTALKLHLYMCSFCRRNARQLRLMRELASNQTASHNESTKLGSEASKRIAEALRQDNQQS